MDTLPGEMLRKAALNLPWGDLEQLCLSNSRAKREICDNDEFWRLRYDKDYGDPHVLDDLVGYTWYQKYIFRSGMFRVWEIGGHISPTQPQVLADWVVFAKKVSSIGNGVVATINLKDTVDLLTPDSYRSYSIEVLDMFTYIPAPGIVGVCMLTKDGRVLSGHTGMDMIDTGVDNAVAIFSNTYIGDSIMVLDRENNLIHVDGTTVTYTGLKIKYYSGGEEIIAVIDMNDDVWYTIREYEGIQNVDWIHVPNIKGKSVAANIGMIITDLDDRLWGYGDNTNRNLGIGDITDPEFPIPLGMTARGVYMGDLETVIIDTDYNLWYCGTGTHGVSLINIMFPLEQSDVITRPRMLPKCKCIDADMKSNYLYMIGNFY